MGQRDAIKPCQDPDDAALIGDALAGSWYPLDFAPKLEARFRAEGRADRLRHQRRVGFLGIVLLLLSLPTTAELAPDVFRLALALAVPATASSVIILALLRTCKPEWLTDLAVAIFILPVLTLQVILLVTTRSPDKAAFIDSMPLYIMAANVCFQHRFLWALASSACALCIAFIGIVAGGISAAAGHAQAGAVVSAVLLSLIIAHRLEWQNRRAWLFRTRDALSHARLRALSERDGLTGLANRRAVDDRLEHAWAACATDNQPLAIIMLDVDWFKRFNDHYGHPEGDTCLRAIGAAIAEHVRRQGDLAGRYGGEEFILILPGADADTGYAIAERVCEAIQALQIPHVAGPPGAFVTASLGVATATPAVGGSIAGLLIAADAALYEAKRNGRACVACGETAS